MYDTSRENTHRIKSILGMLRPNRFIGMSKVRIGRFFDGGYVMLDCFDRVDTAYSLGINGDVSWDIDMANRGVAIHQYDHTIEHLPAEHELFHWEKIGITTSNNVSGDMDTLANLIHRNGHSSNQNMILKCDIEGHEWGMLAETPSTVLAQFTQIVIEVHFFRELISPEFFERARQAIINLTVHHKVVHVHGNNYAPWVVLGGVALPMVIELTFARRDLGVYEVSDEVFPTAIDMPCNGADADLYLGHFAYN